MSSSFAAPAHVSVMFQIVAGCPACGARMPVSRVDQGLVCPQCRAPTPTPPRFWQRVMGRAVADALPLPEGKGRTSNVRSIPRAWVLHGKMAARCSDPCRTRYPVDALEEAARGAGAVFCPQCGKRASVRHAPDWFASVHPAASLLVGESFGTEGTVVTPTQFHCYYCAEAIPFDGTSTTASCPRCKQRLSVPSGVWRLSQPDVGGGSRFFLLLDIQGAVDSLPTRMRVLCDAAPEPQGSMVVAWHAAEASDPAHASRLGLADHRGLLLWVNERVDFGESACVLLPPGQVHGYVVDGQDGRMVRFRVDTGDVEGEFPPQAVSGKGEPIIVRGHDGIAADLDGTLLVARRSGNAIALRRYGPDGYRIPIWAELETRGEDTVSRKAGRAPRWDALPDRITRLPEDSVFAIGWDGVLHIADKGGRAIARYASDGKLLDVRRTDPVIRRIYGIAADGDGTIVILFSHARPFAGMLDLHVGRIYPNDRFEVWIGAHAPNTPRLLGTGVRNVRVLQDGTLFIVGTLDQARVISRDGEVLWESSLAVVHEQGLRDDLFRSSHGDHHARGDRL